ncbi:hypothetical protein BJ742DRAFT_811697 [Cladochytrium replicatum]|nr:hypothetical protein BJ742DRAFT_811697 [Cladochytrium replicatum]
MSSQELSAAEECKRAAQILNVFVNSQMGGSIPPHFVVQAFGIAILKAATGVAVVRLPSGEWSAPCAIALHNPNGSINDQETVLLFMTERSVVSLIQNVAFTLGGTHRFEPGPISSSMVPIDSSVDVYVWVRFNGGYTHPELLSRGMAGWYVGEDRTRHRRWHGPEVTWYDVLTNQISVDRSSIGNAFYITLRLAVGSARPENGKKNFATIEGLKPSSVSKSAGTAGNPQLQQQQQQQQTQAELMQYQQKLLEQQQQVATVLAEQAMQEQQQLALAQQQQIAQLQQMQAMQQAQLANTLAAQRGGVASPTMLQAQSPALMQQQLLQQQQQQAYLLQQQQLQQQQLTPEQMMLLQQQQQQLYQQQLYQQQQGYGRF